MSVSYLRMLIGDNPKDSDGNADTTAQDFDDNELTTFIGQASGNVKMAAAYALRAKAAAIATDLQNVTTEGLETDGAAIARELDRQAMAFEWDATGM